MAFGLCTKVPPSLLESLLMVFPKEFLQLVFAEEQICSLMWHLLHHIYCTLDSCIHLLWLSNSMTQIISSNSMIQLKTMKLSLLTVHVLPAEFPLDNGKYFRRTSYLLTLV